MLKKKIDQLSFQSSHEFNFKLLDEKTIKNLREDSEEILNNDKKQVLKVYKKICYILKILKIKNIKHEEVQRFIREYEIMNSLNHPNILKTCGLFLGSEEIEPSILLEYCSMDLDKAIKNKILSKVQLACSVYQIACGMKFIHFRKIIHRDLKPKNILISSDGTIKIGDFGISKLISNDGESMTDGMGTLYFMAPEIDEKNYNEKVDVYSFGVLIYFILSNGEMPRITIKDKFLGKKAEIPKTFTDFSRELIDSCWNFAPEDRPSFENIYNQLKDHTDQLLEFDSSEIIEVKDFIAKHEKMIPHY